MRSLSSHDEYQRWVKAVVYLNKRKWRCFNNWIFISPEGSKHDLSCANLSKEALNRIQDEKIFLVQ
jgi:hypothetical protein